MQSCAEKSDFFRRITIRPQTRALNSAGCGSRWDLVRNRGRAYRPPPVLVNTNRVSESVSGYLLRLHGVAQSDNRIGIVANRGGNHDGAVFDCGFGCQNLVLNGLRRNSCEVLVGHDANATLGEA